MNMSATGYRPLGYQPQAHNPRGSSSSLQLDYPQPPADWANRSDEDSSLPLNTPWSAPPTSASAVPRRDRGSSIGDSRRRAASPPRPVVVQVRAPSRERLEYPHQSSSRTLLVPAHSSHRRSRSDQTSYSTHIARYYDSHVQSLEEARTAQNSTEVGQRGRTRFPRRLVSREAAEEKGYAFSLDDNGAVTVLQALTTAEIEALVTLTEEIRRRRHPRKAVTFFEKTLVHEVPPSAPSPPPCSDDPPASLSQRILLVTGAPPGARTSTYSPFSTYLHTSPPPPTYLRNSLPKFEPLSPPGPSTPQPTLKPISFTIETPAVPNPGKTAEEKIVKAAEKAEKAERMAGRKERQAEMTGRMVDEEEAWRARDRANELRVKAVQKEKKEAMRREKRRRDGTIRIGKNQRGEVVIVG